MKESPILMSTPMVVSTLKGRKTKTRRVLKMPPRKFLNTELDDLSESFMGESGREYVCQYGKACDILWVKETFYVLDFNEEKKSVLIIFKDLNSHWFELSEYEWEKFMKWKRKKGGHSSLFMFKSMSRIRLLIKSIQIERLQDISAEDIKAEGVYWSIDYYASLLQNWQDLWIKINGPESWEANPWVWCITFQKLD